MNRRRALGAIAIVTVAFGTAGCATTIDSSNTTVPANTTTTVFVPVGTTDELLAQLLVELGGLSEAIVDNAHQREIIARADALWNAARDDVAARHHRLLIDFDDAMALAHLGVDRRRPADADKAYVNLRALVAALPTADATIPTSTG